MSQRAGTAPSCSCCTNPDENEEMVEFSDEEGYGKYLDLHECYEQFVNLKHATKIEYLTYLTSFDRLFEFPKDRK
ncbi:hypothetical protein ACHWQZ_G006300 [Mnemiopsis leidyi]